MINKVTIVGFLGQDPILTHLPDGKPSATFSVATNETWKDKKTGEKKESTEWHRVVTFGKLASIISQYAKSGSKVYIEGKLQTRKYNKDGVDHYITEILIPYKGMFKLLDGNVPSQVSSDLVG